MNQTEIGKFIAKCRKEKKLTQMQLAEKLNITDRAVSKWETGKSMPDSSIMLELCNILGITVNELLSGEEIDTENMESYEKRLDENLITLKRKDENNMKKNVMISILYSGTFLTGIMVCLICNLAISGNIWKFNMVPDSDQFHCFCMGHIFSKHYTGKKGNHCKFNILKCFYYSLFVFVEQLDKSKRSIFYWCRHGGSFHRILVEHRRSV